MVNNFKESEKENQRVNWTLVNSPNKINGTCMKYFVIDFFNKRHRIEKKHYLGFGTCTQLISNIIELTSLRELFVFWKFLHPSLVFVDSFIFFVVINITGNPFR